MIFCVWYPSGGFGNFVNGILNLHGTNFVRPKNQLAFSSNGNSHSLDHVAPRYFQNQKCYNFEFDTTLNYSVLVDTGIDNENTNFVKFFPGAKVIKICYDNWSWPIVANTMITKALANDLVTTLPIDSRWPSLEPWAQREKYFLFLRDHDLRNSWKPDDNFLTLNISDLLDYNCMREKLTTFEIELDDFRSIWKLWFDCNQCYINPVIQSSQMLQGPWHNLSSIWDQAVFYYQIWCEYGVEVPHNQFMNFFQSQQEYNTWIATVT